MNIFISKFRYEIVQAVDNAYGGFVNTLVNTNNTDSLRPICV